MVQRCQNYVIAWSGGGEIVTQIKSGPLVAELLYDLEVKLILIKAGASVRNAHEDEEYKQRVACGERERGGAEMKP